MVFMTHSSSKENLCKTHPHFGDIMKMSLHSRYP